VKSKKTKSHEKLEIFKVLLLPVGKYILGAERTLLLSFNHFSLEERANQ
jgi:hypothetical protein